MDEFSLLGGGNSRGSFIYLSSSSSAATGTTMASPTPPPSSATYGLSFYPAALLQKPSPPTFKDEAGPSQYQSQKHGETSQGDVETIKAKIISHPQYPSLLGAYMDCQKVGAPPEVIARLSAITRELEACPGHPKEASADPELDQFMDTYCDLLVKYREELARPLQEATDFLKNVESQFNALTNGAWARFFSTDFAKLIQGEFEMSMMGELNFFLGLQIKQAKDGIFINQAKYTRETLKKFGMEITKPLSTPMSPSCKLDKDGKDEKCQGVGPSELLEIEPHGEDKELKRHLLKKYSGYLGSLRQELSKKKKKGKLPKEARQKLLSWWELHYRWPYPSEMEKEALAKSTGLESKQINNWFINQRKRHWKPSEDMQLAVDGFHPQNASAATLFMEGQFMGDGMYRLGQ